MTVAVSNKLFAQKKTIQGTRISTITKEVITDITGADIKDKYEDGMVLDDALKLALAGLFEARGEQDEKDPAELAKRVEIGRIDTTEKRFKILSEDEVTTILTP